MNTSTKIGYISIALCFLSCADSNPYLYSDKIEKDGGHYFVFHMDNDCINRKKTFLFNNKSKISDYVKLKNHKYCTFCFRDVDIEMVDVTSRMNQLNITESYSSSMEFDPGVSDFIDYFDEEPGGELKSILYDED